ncbi:hypothetical protein NOF04DRAFT_1332819 [Fusarium oxysporum II5]|nr:hypothetical protein DER44DRAFT_792436 [Fusarium oxysporum]KAK2125247.1 hypothetical protein NOF04DRAFT_1332819 [Fusarium oxysporum II5]
MGDPKKIKIKLRGGDIEAAHDGSIFKARGVRYASASRFQLPVVIEGWDGTLDYTQPASICSHVAWSRVEKCSGKLGRQDERFMSFFC